MIIKKNQKFFQLPLTHEMKMNINEKYHLEIGNVSWIGAEGLIRKALHKYEPDNPFGFEQIPIEQINKYRNLIGFLYFE